MRLAKAKPTVAGAHKDPIALPRSSSTWQFRWWSRVMMMSTLSSMRFSRIKPHDVTSKRGHSPRSHYQGTKRRASVYGTCPLPCTRCAYYTGTRIGALHDAFFENCSCQFLESVGMKSRPKVVSSENHAYAHVGHKCSQALVLKSI